MSHCTALNTSLLTYSRNNKDSKMNQGFPNKYKGWGAQEILLGDYLIEWWYFKE